MDIYNILALLGHSQVTTTQIYVRISDKQLTNAVNDAFNVPLHHQVIPQDTIKRLTSAKPNQSPMEYLQMQVLQGEITRDEYRGKLLILKEAK